MSDEDVSNHLEVQTGNLDKGVVEDPKYVEAMLKKADEGTDTTGGHTRKFAGKYADGNALRQGAENLMRMKLSKMTDEEAEAFYNEQFGKKEDPAPTEGSEPAVETPPTAETSKETPGEPEAEGDNTSGLDLGRMQEEYLEEGKLSDDSMAQLNKLGFGPAEVDVYMAGLETRLNQTYAKAGGKESYFQMLDWAGKNLTDSEITAFNTTLQTHNIDNITLAVEGLYSKYTAVNGKGPIRKVTPTVNDITANAGYSSKAEMVEAMKDSRYGKDRAYTERVEQKVFKSRF